MGRALNLYLCHVFSICKGAFLNRELGLRVVEQLFSEGKRSPFTPGHSVSQRGTVRHEPEFNVAALENMLKIMKGKKEALPAQKQENIMLQVNTK